MEGLPRVQGRIAIMIERAVLSRWVLALRDYLIASGATEVLIFGCDGSGRDRSLQLLLDLERLVLGRGRVDSWTEIIDTKSISLCDKADLNHAEIVLDLRSAGEQLEGRFRVLQPRFNGARGEQGLSAALFFHGTPEISVVEVSEDGRETVCSCGCASLEAADGHAGAMEAVWSRTMLLLAKSVQTRATRTGYSSVEVGSLPAPRSISASKIALRTTKSVAAAAAKALYKLCCDAPYWRVGWRFSEENNDVLARHDLGGERWSILPALAGRFLADPVPIVWQGKTCLFVEELPYKTNKGIISYCIFNENGQPGPLMPVLEEAWHLSYPFLWQEGDQLYMIPESSLSGKVTLYRAVDFPLHWEACATLIEGVEAADVTLTRHAGRLWMFAVVRPAFGGYSDTLAIWSSDDLFGPWLPHPHNPILVDDRFARPAGNLIQRNGQLFRPVQDCRNGYGTGLNLMKVDRLDEVGFSQSLISSLRPGGSDWPGHKLHTLNRAGKLEVIDGSAIHPRNPLANRFAERYFRPKGAA